MKESAGLVIIQNGRILLGHPTGSPWFGTYSIPKGEIEPSESALEAALRETEEEIGIKIDPSDVTPESGIIEYKDDLGEVYKTVEYFVALPKRPIVLDPNKLQKREIDWAGFLTKDEAAKRIFGRFRSLLKYLE